MRTATYALIVSVLLPGLAFAQETNLRYYYPVPAANPAQVIEADLVVYGGTPGGVTAAIQANRMGKKAVLFSFNTFVGGLTSGGLTATDVGNRGAIGGMANEFFARVGRLRDYKPSEAERVYLEMLKEANVPIYFEHRLSGVTKEGNRITGIAFENGNSARGKMFVDATYEGDLFATAGVSYHVGRESNATYGETINGVQYHNKHQFEYPTDPYVKEGDPSSGLLWGISDDPNPGKTGEGDRKLQAYNFRMNMSDAADRIPFPRPAAYDPTKYALLARYLPKKPNLAWSFVGGDGPIQLKHGDCNNAGAFSSDYIGANYHWADGHYEPGSSAQPSKASTAPKISLRDLYELREKIFQDHVNYQQGLMYFMAHDPSVPEAIRQRVNKWGLTRGEFAKTGGWPHQLYIREGRRMISDYVMTEQDCLSKRAAEDSVGMGSYNMDSHNIQRVVLTDKDGRKIVRNEGDVQIGCPRPYPISYRSIVPNEAECANLFVPVCLSSTHISYGSIRMEPVFTILGQSAGTAASMAIDANIPVQKVDYAKLKERLIADKQVLVWTAPARTAGGQTGGPKSVTARDLKGIVVDAKQAKLTGEWPRGSLAAGVDGDYFHDGDQAKGEKSARFEVKVPADGEYEVRLAYVAHSNRASNTPVTINFAGGSKTVSVDQKATPAIEGLFVSLGKYRFTAGDGAVVTVSNKGTEGHVIVDSVQLLPSR
jgi:hypothetical protein